MELVGLTPDLPNTVPGGFVTCVGYEPTVRGWKIQRVLSPVATSPNPDSANVVAGFVSKTANGVEVVHIHGTGGFLDRTLYRLQDDELTVCSRATAYTGSNIFSFCQWGNYTLATNLSDKVQIRDATTTNDFADSSASAIPKARLCLTWGPPTAPRVMLLHYNNGTDYPDGWWSSHEGGPTADWGPDLANGSANGRLLGAGPLTCGIGYKDTAVAFGTDEMWVGTFDPTVVVAWDKRAQGVGCLSLYAAKVCNDLLYFVGKQGLYVFDGSYPKKVNLPIQQFIVDQIASGFDVQFATDPATNRLLLYVGGVVPRIFSINVLTGKVGELSTANPAFIGLLMDHKYRAAAASSVITLYREDVSPDPGNYWIELNPFGDAQVVTLLRRVIGNFLSTPTTFAVDSATVMSLGDPFRFTGPTTTAKSPWRIDLLKSGRWISLRLYLGTDGTSDPELEAIDFDAIPAGRE